jgi:dihydroneopterin aldolase
MMDTIFLRELQIEAVIGIWEWERRIKQTVSIDLEMATDARKASGVDQVEGSLNYRDVAKRLIDFVGSSQFELVESLAEAVARIVVVDFKVPWAKVSVAKPGAIEGSRTVGITIERTPGDYGG